MKKYKFTAIFLLLSLTVALLCAGSGWALDDPEVSAPNIVLAEMETGQILFTRDETARIYPASLTKIMTALLAVEAIERGETELNTPVMASSNITYDLEADGSTAGITAGEVLTMESLLQCTLVASANEACNIIAEHISGSTEAFIELMNARAAELGCTDTHFANTHGLPNENHYTTAWDMYLISREAIEHDIIANICGMAEVTIPATEVSLSRSFKNTNALLGDNDYYSGYFYEGASGVKTGRTNAAGYCLVATVQRDGISLLSVVMGAQATPRADNTLEIGSFADTIRLFDWAFANYSYQDIVRTTKTLEELPITMGNAESVGVRPQTAVKALLPNDTDMSDFDLTLSFTHEENGEELHAPVNAGDVLGELTVSRDGKVYGRTALVAAKSVELSRWEFIKGRVVAFFQLKIVKTVIIVLIVLALLYIVLVVRYHILRRRHLRSVREARRERDRRAAEQAQTQAREQMRAPQKAPEPERKSAPPIVPEDPVWPEEPKAAEPAPAETMEEIPWPKDIPWPEDLPTELPASKTENAERDYFDEFFS